MKKLTALLGIGLLTSSTGSLASSDHWPDKEQRIHYGIGIGLALPAHNDNNIINAFSAANTNSSMNNDDFSFKLFGGYRFDPFLSLEFGFSDLGNTIATTNGSPSKLFNTYTAYINTIMTQRYNDKAALFGKIGAHFWNHGPNRTSKLAEGTDLSLGAGLELNLYGNSSRVIRIEWDRYLFDNIYIDTIDTLSLNLVFKH